MLRKTGAVGECPKETREASMRPQRNAAENRGVSARDGEGFAGASMRPQRNAAENAVAGTTFTMTIDGFNEAAA